MLNFTARLPQPLVTSEGLLQVAEEAFMVRDGSYGQDLNASPPENTLGSCKQDYRNNQALQIQRGPSFLGFDSLSLP